MNGRQRIEAAFSSEGTPEILAVICYEGVFVRDHWDQLTSRPWCYRLAPERGFEAMAISAVTSLQVRPLLYRAAQMLDDAPREQPVEDMPVYRLEADPRQYQIERRQDGWHVTGEAIERAAAMTYWEHIQSVRRFQRILQALGIEAALRKAGVQNGDNVFIGDYELEWSD